MRLPGIYPDIYPDIYQTPTVQVSSLPGLLAYELVKTSTTSHAGTVLQYRYIIQSNDE